MTNTTTTKTTYAIRTDAVHMVIDAESLDECATTFAKSEGFGSGVTTMAELINEIESIEGAWMRVLVGDEGCASIVCGDF